jgi:parallel beta-helix repeat protein
MVVRMRGRIVFVGVLASVALALSPAGFAQGAHVSCGQTIAADTVLDSDLDCRFAAALAIGAPGITLDLGGHTFLGSIRNVGFDDVRIVNGSIDGGDLTLQAVRRNEIGDITWLDGFVNVNDSHDSSISGLSGTGPFSGTARVNMPGSTGITVADGRWLSISGGSGNRFERLRDSHLIGESDNFVTGNEGGSVDMRGDRNQITGNHVDLVFVFQGDANSVTDNSFTTDGTAISVQFSSSNVIARNRIGPATVSNQSAIFLYQATATTIADNRITGPAPATSQDLFQPSGVTVTNGSGNRILDNVIAGRMRGVDLLSTADNVVTSNVVRETDSSAFFLYLADRNEVSRNKIANAGDHGIEITSFSDDNRVERNAATRSGADGISILAAEGTGNVLSRNYVRFNRDDGIGVDQPGNILSRNVAIQNFDWGIEAVEGTIDGGSNKAAGNRQHAQCLNVVCRKR